MTIDQVLQTAGELKRQFDESFSRPAETDTRATEGVLAIVVGGTRVAVKVLDVRGVHRCPQPTRIPSADSACLGAVSMRGKIAAAYSLSHLLGYAANRETTRWILLVGDGAIGLVFDELVGFDRVPANLIRDVSGTSETERVVQFGEASYALVDVPALVRQIMDSSGERAG